MMEEATLLFRHLPGELSNEESKDLLHHLGATQVRLMGKSGPLKHSAFAVFPNKEKATEVVEQLHQAEFMGSRLVVEFARNKASNTPSVVDKEGIPVSNNDEAGKDIPEELTESEKWRREPKELKFDSTFFAWGLKQPRHPELRYLYPPPTPSILSNIVHALAAVPKFYVQVLHLMNKMDLPAPFGMITQKPPIAPDVSTNLVTDDISQREMDISSSSESELDSGSGEDRVKTKVVKERRSLLKKQRPSKRPRFSNLKDIDDLYPVPSAPVVPVSEVFDQQDSAPLRKIEMKISDSLKSSTIPYQSLYGHEPIPQPQNVLTSALYDPSQPTTQQTSTIPQSSVSQRIDHQFTQSNLSQSEILQRFDGQVDMRKSQRDIVNDSHRLAVPTQGSKQEPEVGGFGVLEPVVKEASEEEEEENSEVTWGKTRFISSSELRKSRLSESERKDINVFRRYNAGEPSCRLYIKNLAKQVREKDLHWVFGRYVNWDKEEQTNIFDIQLMKEGRMKGQAFITLPDEGMAVDACKDTNGFMFHDKPMVVQFARSAKAEKDKASKL